MRCPTWRNIVYDSESGGRVRVGRGWGVGRVRARTVTYKNNNCHYRNVGRGSGVPRRRPRFPFAGTYCGLIKNFARIRVVDSSTRETCTSLQTTLFFRLASMQRSSAYPKRKMELIGGVLVTKFRAIIGRHLTNTCFLKRVGVGCGCGGGASGASAPGPAGP